MECKVARINPFGVIVQLDEGVEGLIHVRRLSDRPIKHPKELVSVSDVLRAKVLSIEYL